MNENTNTPTVTTDLLDYAPGSTATITASGFIIGSTLEFQVLHVTGSGDDGVYGTADDVIGDNSGAGHDAWSVTDGEWWVLDAGADGVEGTADDVIGGDLDMTADGSVTTDWYVNPDDSAGEKFLLTATGVEAGADGEVGTEDDVQTGQVAMAAFTDSNPPPVQTFYVPLPEDQMLQVLDARLTPSDPSPTTDPRDPMTTYIGIAAVANGTFIYYDHWEDGFENDISNPTQDTTEIWGDGNLANGAAPGVVGDVINAGTVIILNNTFATAGRDLTPPDLDIYFDGGDKFAVSKTVAVTRSTWADGSKTLMTDAVEVYDTNNWGTSYKVPVGQNIATSDDLFQYTGLAIMASEDDTVVTIDNDANPGTAPIVVTLDEGESYIVNGVSNQVVNSNATIVATNPVQVHVLTGDVNATYETRWFTLLPTEQWGDSYYTPVSTQSADPTLVWIYNPGLSPIVVDWETGAGSQTDINVGAGALVSRTIPNGTAAHFYTESGAPFYAFTTIDAAGSNGTSTYDWGMTLIPEDRLTTQVQIGLGLGRDPTSSVNPSENSAPVWITVVTPGSGDAEDVKVYVDYDGDNLTGSQDYYGNWYDTVLTLDELQRVKVYDPDGDQSAMVLYLLNEGPDNIPGTGDDTNAKIVAAWGEDPAAASAGQPGFDAGAGIPPLPIYDAGKNATLLVDADGSGLANITPGDTLLYTITINNISRVPVPDIVLEDFFPDETTFVSGSTKINYGDDVWRDIDDDLIGGTLFPLDEGGLNLNSDIVDGFTEPGALGVGGTYQVRFQAIIDQFEDLAPGTVEILNTGEVRAVGEIVRIKDDTPLTFTADIDIEKATNGEDADTATGPVLNVGDPVTWTYVVSNTGGVDLANVVVTDNKLGAITNIILKSGGDQDNVLEPGEVWTYEANGSAQEGQYANIGSVTADAVYADGTTQIAGLADPTDSDASHYLGVALPEVMLIKDGEATIDEGGDVATYTLTITNTSTAETITVISLTDDQFGDLLAEAEAAFGGTIVLAVGEDFSFDIDRPLDLNAGETHTNTATVVVEDDDGSQATDDDDHTVTADDVLPTVMLDKTGEATINEGGDTATYTLTITNTSTVDAVTVTSLSDDQFGDLLAEAEAVFGGTIVLAVGEDFSFDIDRPLDLNAGETHTNTATVVVEDDDGSQATDDDDHTVTADDVLPTVMLDKTGEATINEGGDTATYTLTITNTSTVDAVTVTSLTDDKFGDLLAEAEAAFGGTIVLAVGEDFSFDIDRPLDLNAGETHTNTATVVVEDDDGSQATDDDDHTVTADNVLPTVMLDKTGEATINEGGDTATYTLTITNTSTVDAVTVTSLTDDKFGDLLAEAEAAFGGTIVLAVGEDFSFDIDRPLDLNAGETHTNTATVVVEDDDGSQATDDDDHTVTADDVLPTVMLDKTGEATINEGGDTATYTLTITNTSTVDAVTVTSLTDDKFGDLLAEAEAAFGGTIVLAVGEDFSFDIDRPLNLNADETHTNTATVVVEDDDGSQATDDDDHTVTADDVLPAVSLDKDGEATINEGGDTATYTLTITNTSTVDAVTVTSLTDDKFGDLLAEAEAAFGGTIVLAVGEDFSFDIDRPLNLNADETHTNTATVVVEDDDGSQATDDDDHTVTADDVLPTVMLDKTGEATINEGGDTATYTLTITNTSTVDAVTVTSLTDDKFGDLLAEAEAAFGGTIVLAVGEDFSFDIDRPLDLNAGETHTNTATVVVEDDDGSQATDDDDHTVTADNVLPTVMLDKTGEATINEGGDTATYTLTITNTSTVDAVTVTSLTDDKFGDLLAEAEAAFGGTIVLAVGEDFSFDIDRPLDLNAGETHTNTATVVVEDDDGSQATDDDDHTVTADDVAPSINIEKTVDANGDANFNDLEQLPVGVAAADYQYVLSNTSPAGAQDPLSVDSLIDDRGTPETGDDIALVLAGVLQTGVTLDKGVNNGDELLDVGETWTYTVEDVDLSSLAYADALTNTATVVATDDEDTEATDSDTATVERPLPQQVQVTGYKWNDSNANGMWNYDFGDPPSGEVGLADWTIFVDADDDGELDWIDADGMNGVWDQGEGEQWTVTGAGGLYSMTVDTTALTPGITYQIRELEQSGWLQTYDGSVFITVAQDGSYSLTDIDHNPVNPLASGPLGFADPYNFGNVEFNPALTIDKSVEGVYNSDDSLDADGKVDSQTDYIVYQIVVTNTGNVPLTGVEVYDQVDGHAPVLLTNPVESGGDPLLNNNGILDVGEIWTYLHEYDVQQSDIDNIAHLQWENNPDPEVDLPFAEVNGTLFISGSDYPATGSGLIDSFVRIQAKDSEEGYNTDHRPQQFDEGNTATFNHSILAADVPIIEIGNDKYWEFRLDLNEHDNQADRDVIWLESLKLFSADAGDLTDMNEARDAFVSGTSTLLYDLDAAGPVSVELPEWTTGSGHGDYTVLIPYVENVGDYLILYSAFSDTDGGFEEWYLRKFGLLENTATVTTDQDVGGSDMAEVPVLATADYFADAQGRVAASKALAPEGASVAKTGVLAIDNAIEYTVTVGNDGNVTLGNVVVTDQVEGGALITLTNYDSDTNAFSGDDGNGRLDLGETWTWTYTRIFGVDAFDENGDLMLDNSVTVDADETHPLVAFASVDVSSLVDDGADGFDGLALQAQQASWWAAAIGDGDDAALIAVDANGDGSITGADARGILIGDLNANGLRDAGEVTLFVRLDAAQQLIATGDNASDMRMLLMREALAAQLNVNNMASDSTDDSGNPEGPADLVGEAAAWLRGLDPYLYVDSSGNVDINEDGTLSVGNNKNFEYNIKDGVFTADADPLTSNPKNSTGQPLTADLGAWQDDVDVAELLQASGEDLKDALTAFNARAFVVDTSGEQIAAYDGSEVTGIQDNSTDAFWSYVL